MRQDALRAAIGLVHAPSRVKSIRSAPLPDGVLWLLLIAAGDEEAAQLALEATERSLDVIHEAATFFIEQILFSSNADSYRVLGCTLDASTSELRRNMALLLRWVHPDRDPHGERTVFTAKVTRAWNDLKTPERRAMYDAQRGSLTANGAPWKKRRRRSRFRGRPGTGSGSLSAATAGRENGALNLLRRFLLLMLRPQRRP